MLVGVQYASTSTSQSARMPLQEPVVRRADTCASRRIVSSRILSAQPTLTKCQRVRTDKRSPFWTVSQHRTSLSLSSFVEQQVLLQASRDVVSSMLLQSISTGVQVLLLASFAWILQSLKISGLSCSGSIILLSKPCLWPRLVGHRALPGTLTFQGRMFHGR